MLNPKDIKRGTVLRIKGEEVTVTFIRKHRRYQGYYQLQYERNGEIIEISAHWDEKFEILDG